MLKQFLKIIHDDCPTRVLCWNVLGENLLKVHEVVNLFCFNVAEQIIAWQSTNAQ